MALSIFIVMLGMAGTLGIMLTGDFINRPARSDPRRSALGLRSNFRLRGTEPSAEDSAE